MQPAAVAMRACATTQATPPATVAARQDWVAGKEKVRTSASITDDSSIHASLHFAQLQFVHLSLSKVPYLVGAYGRSRSASPGSSTRKYSPKRWFSRKSLEPVQIKVYEVDDMEKVQKAMDPSFQVQTEVFIFSRVLL